MIVIVRLSGFVKRNYSFIFQKRNLVILLLLGLALRLVFMPFTMMTDLSHNYYQYFEDRSNHAGYFSSVHLLPLSQPMHYLSASFYSLMIPAGRWYDMKLVAEANNPAVDHFLTRTYLLEKALLASPPVHLKIFLLKLPYLIFDMAILFLLPLFFEDEKKKRIAFILWIFNPVAIMDSFIFGTPDVIWIFFVVLAFYQVYRHRLFISILLILFSALFRPYSLLLLPLFLLLMLKDKVIGLGKKMAFISGSIIAFILAAWLIFSRWGYQLAQATTRIPSAYMFTMRMGEFVDVYIFFLAYALVIFAYWHWADAEFKTLCKYSLIICLIFFAMCFFHPQWFLLITPLAIFMIIEDRTRTMGKMFALMMASLMTLLFFWGNHLTINLLAPLNRAILDVPELKDALAARIDITMLFGLLWTFFVAITLFICFLVARSVISDRKAKEELYENQ
ncbi:MAG: hypothetical protein V1866_05690 [archaeon]